MPFEKGQSGKPTGKPNGAKNKATENHCNMVILKIIMPSSLII